MRYIYKLKFDLTFLVFSVKNSVFVAFVTVLSDLVKRNIFEPSSVPSVMQATQYFFSVISICLLPSLLGYIILAFFRKLNLMTYFVVSIFLGLGLAFLVVEIGWRLHMPAGQNSYIEINTHNLIFPILPFVCSVLFFALMNLKDNRGI